jgi:hypothetical protein
MKDLKKELRLLIAEKLLSWAWSIAPNGSPLKDHIINYFENQKQFYSK